MRPIASVRQIIEVEFNRGAGVQDDPIRRVQAYYDLDGRLLAEYDPTNPTFDREHPTYDDPRIVKEFLERRA